MYIVCTYIQYRERLYTLSSQHVSSIFSLLQPQHGVTCKPDWRLQHWSRERKGGCRREQQLCVCTWLPPLHTGAGCHYCEGKGKQSSSHPTTDLNHSQHRGNRQLQTARSIMKQLSRGGGIWSDPERRNPTAAVPLPRRNRHNWYEYVDWTHNAVYNVTTEKIFS